MLDKLKFNNLVITNKKKIQQGRTQTINKLVQKIRKLKSQLEKHPDNSKNKERLRKTTENLDFLKTLKCSDAIKKILLLEKNPSTVITNGLSTPEEVALALLAQNKLTEDLIKIFKEQLDLSDTNLKWREELLEPSKRRAKIDRTEEKKKKRKDVKEQKANERKRQDWIKQNNPYMEEDVCLSATGAWKIHNIELEMEPSLTSINGNLSSKNANADNKINDDKMLTNIAEKVRKEINSSVLSMIIDENKTKPEKINNVMKSKHTKSVMSQTKCSNESLKTTEPQKEIQKEETEPIVTYVVDPFFITDTGENYLTAVNVIDKPSDGSAIKNYEKEEEPYTGSNRRFENSKRDNLNRKQTKNLAGKNDNGDNLHPSWAAKQRNKPVITSFQGKKITFDDDDIGGAIYKHKKMENISKKTVNINVSNNSATQDNLHPSWAAKQRLKPTIAVFQGKKISFTNGYDED